MIPWLNDTKAEQIRSRRKAECIWLKQWDNWEAFLKFYHMRCTVFNLIDAAEHSYYNNVVAKKRATLKNLFSICNNLLGRNQDLPLPLGYSYEELANCFDNFFITKICDALVVNHDTDLQLTYLNIPANPPILSSYSVLTEKELCNIVKCTPSKSCGVDPIPNMLLKEILPTVSSVLANIVNLSMQTGIFQDSLKEAWV